MKRANISEIKNKLSAYIDGLRSGEAVLILDRGRPVAQLQPVTTDVPEIESDVLAKLVRAGIVRPRQAEASDAWLRQSPPEVANANLTEALLEERREGR